MCNLSSLWRLDWVIKSIGRTAELTFGYGIQGISQFQVLHHAICPGKGNVVKSLRFIEMAVRC